MTFRRDVDLDPGQVQDRRGRRISGGGLAIGGGLGTIGTIIVVVVLLLTGGTSAALGSAASRGPRPKVRSEARQPTNAAPAPMRTSARTAASSAA